MAGRGLAAAVTLAALFSLGLVAPVHAGPLDGAPCTAAGAPTRLAQDDARLGRDASDAADAPDRLTPTQNAYYWGWLDVGATRPGADHDDWFAIDLTGAGETAMASITANYTLAGTRYLSAFTLEVYAPGATIPIGMVDSNGGTLTFVDDHAGAWRFHASTPAYADAGRCAATPGSTSAQPTSADQDYGLYFGCNPFCARSG